MDTHVSDRIRLLIQKADISASEFADSIGVNRSRLSHILRGRNFPSLEIIASILKAYPEVDADWLILGNEKKLESAGIIEKKEWKGKRALAYNPDKSNNPGEKSIEDKQSLIPQIREVHILYTNGTYSVLKPEV